jgi:hypothetical protein
VKSFRIHWIEGYGDYDGKAETHEQSWFSEARGFDEDMRTDLDELDIGETLTLGGITDAVEITRKS